MKCTIKCIVLLTLLVSSSFADNPGIRVRLTDKFLKGILKIGDALAQANVKRLPKKIMQISGTAIDDGTKLDNVVIKEYNRGTEEFKFAPENELQYKSTGGKLAASGDLTRNGKTSSAELTVSASIEMSLTFTKSDNHHLQVEQKSCNISMTQFDVKLGDGHDPKTAEEVDKLKSLATNSGPMFCAQSQMMWGLISAYLKSRPSTQYPIGNHGLMFDAAQINPPKATGDYLQFDLSGQITGADRMASPPYNPAAFPEPADNNHMFIFFFSDEFHNFLLREFHENGLITYTINKDSDAARYTRAKERIKLLSETLGTTPTYNGQDDIEVTYTSARAPTIESKAGAGVSFTLPTKLNVKVRPGAADAKEITAVVVVTGKDQSSIKATEEGQLLPDVDTKVTVESVTVESVEGLTLTDEQKKRGEDLIKTKLSEELSAKVAEIRAKAKADNEPIKEIVQYGQLNEAYFKTHDGSVEFGFDINIKGDKLGQALEHLEDRYYKPVLMML